MTNESRIRRILKKDYTPEEVAQMVGMERKDLTRRGKRRMDRINRRSKASRKRAKKKGNGNGDPPAKKRRGFFSIKSFLTGVAVTVVVVLFLGFTVVDITFNQMNLGAVIFGARVEEVSPFDELPLAEIVAEVSFEVARDDTLTVDVLFWRPIDNFTIQTQTVPMSTVGNVDVVVDFRNIQKTTYGDNSVLYEIPMDHLRIGFPDIVPHGTKYDFDAGGLLGDASQMFPWVSENTSLIGFAYDVAPFAVAASGCVEVAWADAVTAATTTLRNLEQVNGTDPTKVEVRIVGEPDFDRIKRDAISNPPFTNPDWVKRYEEAAKSPISLTGDTRCMTPASLGA